MKKKVLFIDRDGTLILDPPPSYQIDSFPKLTFYPHVFENLIKIAHTQNFELVMVTNQDGLGTEAFPESTFWEPHNFILKTFENEGIHFSEVLIDRTFPEEKKDTRKPGTGMLKEYFSEEYDLPNSFVIGDRITDVLLAKNLGCKAIYLNNQKDPGADEVKESIQDLEEFIALNTAGWKEIYEFLFNIQRSIIHSRKTNETEVTVFLQLDGSGKSEIHTGLHFFDHMLEQLARHSSIDLRLQCQGDLHIDEHHTIEDTAITLGEAFAIAMGNKAGMERYGFLLPMDDSLAQVALDFGGRSWLVWDVNFKREKIGDVPTEMFYHFFKSFSDGARCNLNIQALADNEHHLIESIFKALAKSIMMAVRRDSLKMNVPSTKGTL